MTNPDGTNNHLQMCRTCGKALPPGYAMRFGSDWVCKSVCVPVAVTSDRRDAEKRLAELEPIAAQHVLYLVALYPALRNRILRMYLDMNDDDNRRHAQLWKEVLGQAWKHAKTCRCQVCDFIREKQSI